LHHQHTHKHTNTRLVYPIPACWQLFYVLLVRPFIWITLHCNSRHTYTQSRASSAAIVVAAPLCCLNSKVTYTKGIVCLTDSYRMALCSRTNTGWIYRVHVTAVHCSNASPILST
jgi:hypothetical protein